MKLRVRGNSLRLRLTRSEIRTLETSGGIEESVEFGPGPAQRLVYGIHASEAYDQLGVRYGENRLIVLLPLAAANEWTETERNSLSGEVPLEGHRTLSVLLEKDYHDLSEDEPEPSRELYPTPVSDSHDDTLDQWDEPSD
jgi:hypothetical protein